MDWTTNLDKISKQLNKYCHPTCWGISQKRWIMTPYCINGFQWRCSTLPSRASSTPETSTWLEKENSIIPTDQILNESLQSKTETRHEVFGSELKKATYNLLLRNKWTLAPRKSPREVCNSFRLNLSPIDINYLPKSSQKSYETWVKGPKPLDLWYGGMPCGPGSRSKSHGLRTLIRIQGSGR
ncbi:hypothetical protein Peur_054464 [Populus x canadensis]